MKNTNLIQPLKQNSTIGGLLLGVSIGLLISEFIRESPSLKRVGIYSIPAVIGFAFLKRGLDQQDILSK